MKFKLKCILIKTTPRTGYYVANKNDLVTIVKTDTKKGICKLSNGESLSIDNAQHVVAKLIGEVTNNDKTYTYSVVHGDYPIVMSELKFPIEYSEDVPEEARVYKTYAEALIDGNSMECEGEYEVILTKTEPNEVIEITNIDIIDKYELYDKVNRVGIVKEFNKAKQTFTIDLNNIKTDDILICKRKDFKKVHSSNTITMLRIKCPHCKRYGC